MRWLERQFLCNRNNRYEVFAVCGLRTLILILYLSCAHARACVSMCVCSLWSLEEMHCETIRHSVKTPLQLHPVWSGGCVQDSDMDVWSFRILKKKKEMQYTVVCMPCQTIKLQTGAQFSFYTQVYVHNQCVQWNVLTKLTKQWWPLSRIQWKTEEKSWLYIKIADTEVPN